MWNSNGQVPRGNKSKAPEIINFEFFDSVLVECDAKEAERLPRKKNDSESEGDKFVFYFTFITFSKDC